MSLAAEERRALCDLFDEVGPDAPTLCDGWVTRDLAAHLVIRERRPDAAPGILLPVLDRWTALVQRRAARRPWRELVGDVRGGPPRWSPFRLPPLGWLNLIEYFVHHEDVRRARPGASPRPPHPARDAALWTLVALAARRGYRRSPVGITVRRPSGEEHVGCRGPRPVTITGEPGELLLHAFGRDAAVVSFDGAPADVAAVRGLGRSV